MTRAEFVWIVAIIVLIATTVLSQTFGWAISSRASAASRDVFVAAGHRTGRIDNPKY